MSGITTRDTARNHSKSVKSIRKIRERAGPGCMRRIIKHSRSAAENLNGKHESKQALALYRSTWAHGLALYSLEGDFSDHVSNRSRLIDVIFDSLVGGCCLDCERSARTEPV